MGKTSGSLASFEEIMRIKHRALNGKTVCTTNLCVHN